LASKGATLTQSVSVAAIGKEGPFPKIALSLAGPTSRVQSVWLLAGSGLVEIDSAFITAFLVRPHVGRLA
jgi:hypothetical protein